MQPSLRDGDVLLVRKADFVPRRQWHKWTANGTADEAAAEEEERMNAVRAIAHDASSDRPIGDLITGYTYLHPPTIHKLGSVIVFRAPDCKWFPMGEYRVKRVVGLGGQIVAGRFRVEEVPPFGLWVEGDNHDDDESNEEQRMSIDSRTYGPISKNLLIGIAERVLWPPSCWGVIPCVSSPVPRSWWP
jgi:hypothetical protein